MGTTAAILAFLLGESVFQLSSHANDALKTAGRPNFVVILRDDQGYGDLGCYGHPYLHTPHLDRHAQQGLRLTACYAPAANCSPTRTGLLTGRTPARAGVYTAIPMFGPMHLREGEMVAIKNAQPERFELYNLRRDIAETTDLSDAEPERKQQLVELLLRIYHEVCEEAPVWPAWTHQRYEARRIQWPDYQAGPAPEDW